MAVDSLDEPGAVHLLALRDDVVTEIPDVGRYVAAEDVDLTKGIDDRPVRVVRPLEVGPRLTRHGAPERTPGDEAEAQSFDLHDLPVPMP